MGNGLSLISVQDLNHSKDAANQWNNWIIPHETKRNFQENEFIEQQQKTLIEKILNNRILIHMRHEQLMAKASQLLYYPSNNNDPSFENKFLSNNDSTFPTMNFVHD